MTRSPLCWLCPLVGLAVALACLAAPPAAHAQGGTGPVSFIKDIAPILKENCFACHDAKKKKGKLDMTSYESLRKGGISEDPIVPGKEKESKLYEVLVATDKSRMPPKEAGEALAKEKIALIARWIKEGAKLDPGLDAKADLVRELRKRWQPPTPPAVYKHPANVTAITFTPDSKKIVVGGNHELTVWDVQSGKLEKRLYTRAERTYGMVFLPDGKLAVAGGRPGQEGDVRIYNLNAPGKKEGDVTILDGVKDKAVLVAELLETDDEVRAIALSRDGKKLAAGGCDRQVRVWDLSAGPDKAKLEHAIENHADWVFGVVFSPDGKFLLTASRDKTAKVWDLTAKESVLTFPDHQAPVFGVAITDDGLGGISVGEDKNVRFWQATDKNKQLGKQIRAVAGHTKGIFRIVQHSDPKNPLLGTCSGDGSIRLWNTSTGAAIRTFTGLTDWAFAVAISPDGQLIAGGGGLSGEVRIWKISDGNLVQAFNASPGYVPPKVAGK